MNEIAKKEKMLLDYIAAADRLRTSAAARAVHDAAEKLGSDPLGLGSLYWPGDESGSQNGEVNAGPPPVKKQKQRKKRLPIAESAEILLTAIPGGTVEIADKLGWSREAVVRAAKQAEADGNVRLKKKRGRGGEHYYIVPANVRLSVPLTAA